MSRSPCLSNPPRLELPTARLLLQRVEDSHPDGGDAGRHGDALALEQVEQVLRVEVGSGEHQLRPGERAPVGQAPGIDVEHRHDRQQRVRVAQREPVGEGDEHRVQHGGSVRVHDALGLARGPRGVAKAAGILLGKRGLIESAARRADERLVVDAPGGRLARRVADDDDLLERRPGAELVEQRQEHVVDDEEAVLRVRRDVGKVVGREAQVERVHHAAGERRAEVRLQVRRVVPHEGGDPVALAHPCVQERAGQGARATDHRAPGRAVQRPVGLARDHFDVGEIAGRAIREERHGQRDVHHRSAHPYTPGKQAGQCTAGWVRGSSRLQAASGGSTGACIPAIGRQR